MVRTLVSLNIGITSGGVWQSGMFDRGSWVESHPGWARTVVTGRARLGGHPVGVIAVETQSVTRHLPADPGMPDSSEQNIPQVGGYLMDLTDLIVDLRRGANDDSNQGIGSKSHICILRTG